MSPLRIPLLSPLASLPAPPPVSSAPRGPTGGGGAAEAAPGAFDLLAAAARRVLPSGAQNQRGGCQEGQAPWDSQQHQDARDLPTGQRPTREKDSGVQGGERVKTLWDVKLDGDGAARAAAGSRQEAASGERPTAPMSPPSYLEPRGSQGAKDLGAAEDRFHAAGAPKPRSMEALSLWPGSPLCPCHKGAVTRHPPSACDLTWPALKIPKSGPGKASWAELAFGVTQLLPWLLACLLFSSHSSLTAHVSSTSLLL